MKRLDSLQVYRGITAILILLYHISDYSEKSPDSIFRTSSFTFTYGFVDFFLVLTGFTLLYAYAKDIGHPDRLLPYLRGRFIRVYPFYWVVCLAKIAALLLMPAYGKSYERDPLYIIKSLLLIPQSNLPIIGAAWILSYFILFYLVFGLIILLGRRWGVVLLAIWAASILGAAAGNSLNLFSLSSNGLLRFLLYPRNLEFILGFVGAFAVERKLPKHPLLVLLIGLLLLTLGRFYIYLVPVASALELTFVVGLPAFVVIMGSAVLDQRNWIRFPRFLVFFGTASYSIYLAGFAVVSVCAVLLFRPPFTDIFAPMWLILTVVVLGILGACVVHLSIEKPLLAFLKHRAVSPEKQLAVSPSLARGGSMMRRGKASE